jgi:hypothetical protein
VFATDCLRIFVKGVDYVTPILKLLSVLPFQRTYCGIFNLQILMSTSIPSATHIKKIIKIQKYSQNLTDLPKPQAFPNTGIPSNSEVFSSHLVLKMLTQFSRLNSKLHLHEERTWYFHVCSSAEHHTWVIFSASIFLLLLLCHGWETQVPYLLLILISWCNAWHILNALKSGCWFKGDLDI